MSDRLVLAKHLIGQDKLETAKKILTHDTNNLETLRILSLLHRYYDKYDLEHTIVTKALEIAYDDTYMRERLAWHGLSPFEKHEARPPLNLLDNPNYIPKHETLDQLCFVTGGDSNYFEYIVECIESIKNEKRYHNANVCVINTGLTTDEVEYLCSKLNVTHVVDPGWNLPFTTMNFKTSFGIDMKRTKEEARCYQFIMNAIFAHETFPEYEYFFIIQPDLWIHDSRFLDQMICIAERKSMCRVYADLSQPVQKGHFFRAMSIPIPKDAQPYIQTKYFPISGISCMNKATSKKVAAYYKKFVLTYGLWLGYEEISATVFLNSLKNPADYVLPCRHCLSIYDNFGGIHCLRKNRNILVGSKGEFFDFVPLSPNNRTHATGENRKDRSLNNFYKKVQIFDSNNEYTRSPVRFRGHLWKNKEKIKNILTNLAGKNHEF
jgi:hypothetical protein